MPKVESIFLSPLVAAALLTSACAAESAARPESAGAEPASRGESILSSSVPANGAKLGASPNALVLNFARPVRLAEVTVTGTDGSLMPMMVSSAGANRRYELSLDGLERGGYTVHWRAVDEAGVTHEGDISFEIG